MYSSIEISILIHATEDENKVLKPVLEFIEQSAESIKIDFIKTEGHWKNPIHRLVISVDKEPDKIFKKLYTKLVENYSENEADSYIKTNTDKKGYFYIRLDKQKFCIGKIIFSDRDSIRMIFKKLGKFEPKT
ncbi:MAG TPA: RNA-binding domain-containing protein [Candidatus Sulfopaludibacter sp.]|nr:RNA-binding domain-containing protein [Candidatus Sulfopaludibacter sp.]